MAFLDNYQIDAVNKMHNGCILVGGVGSGKSRTALTYYFKCQGGSMDPYRPPSGDIQDLYIITTAKKRDSFEWEYELLPFVLDEDITIIDSWNNIGKYVENAGAFFIFDEQHISGSGAWVKSFLRIAKHNNWILLSATPADTWSDLIPVFIANGYYKNFTDFRRKHVVYNRYTKYPKIDRYINTGILIKQKREVIVEMDYETKAKKHNSVLNVGYDKDLYHAVMVNRQNPFKENEPIQDAAALCFVLRKIVNSSPERLEATKNIIYDSMLKRAIIFYNFDYELDALRSYDWGEDIAIAEWNGHKHEPIPKTKHWIYLVHYTSGSEGWNCTDTDTVIFFSQNYSYKTTVQAAGRIDRRTTPFSDLYYYYIRTPSSIDRSIAMALKQKKKFNENKFVSSI